MGPRALREASTMWAFQQDHEPLYDGEAGVSCSAACAGPTAATWRSARCGTPSATTTPWWRGCSRSSRRASSPSRWAATTPSPTRCSKALWQARAGGPFQLVQFDTHMDYWDSEGGQRYSHASPIIRAHEAGWLSGLTQYGIRSLHTAGDNIELAQSRGAHIFWCEQARDARPAELVEHLQLDADTYITFDIDVLDPAIAPGTGTPEPGGFSYYEAKALLLAVCERTNVIGMDLVEVAPQYDGPGQLTALHGARLILDTVGAAFRRRG